MAQRITWQNITAPDMSDAIRARESAAEMISRAFTGIAGSLGQIDDRNVNQLNMVAQDKALQIQDAGQWEKMMANGGLASLGIDPARANSTLMNYADGRKSDLLSEDSKKIDNKNANLNYNKGVYDFGRAKVMDGREDAAYEDALAREALLKQVNEDVFKLSETEVSKESLVARIENEARAQNWDAAKTSMYLEAAKNQDDIRWSVAPGIKEDVELETEFKVVRDGLSERDAARQLKLASNDTLRFYEKATSSFGEYKNMGDGLSQKFMAKVDPSAPAEEKAVHSQKAGEIQDLYNSVKSMPEFKDLPAEMVALALEEHIQSDGWFFSSDQTEIDEKGAIEMLRRMSTGLDLGTLEKERSQIDYDRRVAERDRRAYDNAVTKAALARDNNDAEGYERAMAELGKLSKDIVPKAGPPLPTEAEPDDAFPLEPIEVFAEPLSRTGAVLSPQSLDPSVWQIGQSMDNFYPGSGYADVMRGGPRMPPTAPTAPIAPSAVVPPIVEPQRNVEAMMNQVLNAAESDGGEALSILAERVGLPERVSRNLVSLQKMLEDGVHPQTGAELSVVEKAFLRAELERILESAKGTVGNQGIEELKGLLK
jgi:hypothetical protein